MTTTPAKGTPELLTAEMADHLHAMLIRKDPRPSRIRAALWAIKERRAVVVPAPSVDGEVEAIVLALQTVRAGIGPQSLYVDGPFVAALLDRTIAALRRRLPEGK